MTQAKKNALINYKKADSLLKKVVQMTEDGEYCIDIMQQNLAVIGLLKSAYQQLLENHLNTCFAKVINSKNTAEKKKMVDEILKISKFAGKFSCNWSLK